MIAQGTLSLRCDDFEISEKLSIISHSLAVISADLPSSDPFPKKKYYRKC